MEEVSRPGKEAVLWEYRGCRPYFGLPHRRSPSRGASSDPQLPRYHCTGETLTGFVASPQSCKRRSVVEGGLWCFGWLLRLRASELLGAWDFEGSAMGKGWKELSSRRKLPFDLQVVVVVVIVGGGGGWLPFWLRKTKENHQTRIISRRPWLKISYCFTIAFQWKLKKRRRSRGLREKEREREQVEDWRNHLNDPSINKQNPVYINLLLPPSSFHFLSFSFSFSFLFPFLFHFHFHFLSLFTFSFSFSFLFLFLFLSFLSFSFFLSASASSSSF